MKMVNTSEVMEMLEHHYISDDIHISYGIDSLSPDELNIVSRYWTHNDGKFVETVEKIAHSIGLSSGKFSTYFSNLPILVNLESDRHLCLCCSEGPAIKNRTDYQSYLKKNNYLDKDGFCEGCAYWEKPLAPNSDWILGHLNRVKLNKLLQRYYEQEDCTQLIQDYSINIEAKEFENSFEATSSSGKCIHCAKSFHFPVLSQMEYLSESIVRLVQCKNCEHEAMIEITHQGAVTDPGYGLAYNVAEYKSPNYCKCKQCEDVRNNDPIIRRQRIIGLYIKPKEVIRIENLSLKNFLGLLGVLWARTEVESDHFILRPNIERMTLTPNDIDKWEWIKSLIFSRAIFVDAETSSLDAFSGDDLGTYTISKVVYRLNVSLNDVEYSDSSLLFNALLGHLEKGFWQESWSDQLLPIWKELAISECKAYFEERAEYYNLGIPNEDKIQQVVSELLETFSVSHIWYMISIAYMNAAAFYQTESCASRLHAINTIISKIKDVSEKNQIKSWNRIKEIPRCAIVEVLFDVVLGAGNEVGFTLSPGLEWGNLLTRLLDKVYFNKTEIAIQLPSNEVLQKIKEEYSDERIHALIAYAIETRKYLEKIRN